MFPGLCTIVVMPADTGELRGRDPDLPKISYGIRKMLVNKQKEAAHIGLGEKPVGIM